MPKRIKGLTRPKKFKHYLNKGPFDGQVVMLTEPSTLIIKAKGMKGRYVARAFQSNQLLFWVNENE